MRGKMTMLLPALLCQAGIALAAPDLALIPAPASHEYTSGAFTVEADTQLAVSPQPQAVQTAHYFGDLMLRTRGLRPAIVQTENPAAIRKAIQFTLQQSGATPGSYRLEVTSQGILLTAGDSSGLFYGAITLWQVLSADSNGSDSIRVSGMRISDQPRLRWRALALDSARQFQSVEFIKRFIDAMALHKLNVLQWHLADDQAWRLESRRYPQLTAVNGIGTKFYTQRQVSEIVAYAAERHVAIVPSFSLPANSSAVLAAYPQFSAGAAQGDLLSADEVTLTFVGEIIGEAAQVFPGEFVSLGIPDFPFERWRATPRVQARMRELGFASEHQLYQHFIQRLQTAAGAGGRRIIGWDQMTDGSALVLSSKGLDGALSAVAAGYDVVVSSSDLLSFERRQSTDAVEVPGPEQLLRLEDVYSFDPAPTALGSQDLQHLIGVQANVWTDYARSELDTEALAFPRAAALAEIAWSPANRQNWAAFVARLVPQMRRYDKLGIAYSDAAFRVAIIPRSNLENSRMGIELSRQAVSGEIRYTLNGSEPNSRSPVYRDILEVRTPATVKAATFVDSQPLSSTATLSVSDATVAVSGR